MANLHGLLGVVVLFNFFGDGGDGLERIVNTKQPNYACNIIIYLEQSHTACESSDKPCILVQIYNDIVNSPVNFLIVSPSKTPDPEDNLFVV
uniref:Uncharacterized protein n=1 Tax=Anopheles albimanus TaxID=7167 RepID=A0A182FNK6_ANOAL